VIPPKANNVEFGSWYDTKAQNPKKETQEPAKTTEPSQPSSNKKQKETNLNSSNKKEK